MDGLTAAALPAGTRVLAGPVPHELDGAVQRWVCAETDGASLLVRVPHVGRFLVRGGDEVVVDAPGADPDALQRYVAGPVTAALHQQRGRLVVRGATITDGATTVVLAGRSMSSAPAVGAALVAGEWRLVSAAPSALEGTMVVPGAGRLPLSAADAEVLGIEVATLRPVQPGSNVLALDVDEVDGDAPPVTDLVVITHAPRDDHPDIAQPTGSAAFLALAPVLHRDLAQGGGWLDAVAALTAATRLTTISRPAGLSLDRVIRLVAEVLGR